MTPKAECWGVERLHLRRSNNVLNRCEMGRLTIRESTPAPSYSFELLKKDTGRNGNVTLFLHYRVMPASVHSHALHRLGRSGRSYLSIVDMILISSMKLCEGALSCNHVALFLIVVLVALCDIRTFFLCLER